METQVLCQSCGMMIDNTEFLGTEKDGSVSNEYCDECYNEGEFRYPDLTIDEMKDIVIDEMDSIGASSEKIDVAVKNLNNLKGGVNWLWIGIHGK